MDTKKLSIPVYLLVVSLLLCNCGPGQLLGPTLTPSPTQTQTPTKTPTLTPSPTKTPTPTPTIDLTATVEYEASKLEDVAMTFCREKNVISGSTAYDPKSLPNPILVCNNHRCQSISDLLEQPIWLDYLSRWAPKNAKDIQLVLCEDEAKESMRPKGHCDYHYTDPQTGEVGESIRIPVYQPVDYFDLYETKTGNKLKSFQIPGNPDIYCPTVIDTRFTTEIVGKSDNNELFKQLLNYLDIQTPTPTPIVYALNCDIDEYFNDEGHLTGHRRIEILGEQENPQWEHRGTRREETLGGEITKVIVTIDRTLKYKSTGHKYEIKGTITISKTDPKLTYNITATGDAFTISSQSCIYP